jgi:hypothetical protein
MMKAKSRKLRVKKDQDGNAFFPSSIEIWLDSYWKTHIERFQSGKKSENAKKDMLGNTLEKEVAPQKLTRKELETKVHQLIHTILITGEEEILGHISSIHQKKLLVIHQ